MITNPAVSIIGNATRDPELRYTQSGVAVASFGVAVNQRKKNHSGEWEDAPAQFFDVTVWNQLAENVSQSITKGTRVIVVGRLEQQSWETQDSDKRSRVQVVADAVGPDLRWANAVVERTERTGAPQAVTPARPDYTEEDF